ncbi:MAG: type I-E CRISPR-associated protein Cse2/CasB [Panacagrimonas sp.]
MSHRFDRNNHAGEQLLQWWQGLDDHRADRAVLRRCASVAAISISPAYQRFYRSLLAKKAIDTLSNRQKDRLAAAAGLLAYVKNDTEGTEIAVSFSQPAAASDRPPVSELRFVRLLESPDLDALFTGLRRALPLTSHSVDVIKLTNDVLTWGDAVKKRWAYEYLWPTNS